MKPSTRGHQQSGFSLLELLVALAVLSLIAIGLSQSMDTAISIWKRSKIVQLNQQPLALRGQLRRWLELAAPSERNFPYDTSFLGADKEMAFLSRAPVLFDRQVFALRIHIKGHSNAIWMTLDYLDEADQLIRSEQHLLAGNTGEIQISYFEGNNGRGEWRDEWKSPRSLPVLIKIEATEDTLIWPEFTVTPLLR